MTETVPTNNQPRALQPRRLDNQESLQSLNHWRSVFRNFYRRCPYYGLFLLPSTTWDSSHNRGFTTEESTGLKRDVETLAADLEGFLDCLGSYCPFDYVGEKLKNESTSISSVWDILYEIYDLEITTSNFLDYALMRKEPDESYRSYFNRLVGFVRKHLPKTEIKAEGITSQTTGETLSISLLDTIAIHWLITIDKKLVNIVKTEFASELKTKRLCQMVKVIDPNIDDLLTRYNTKDQISLVKVKTEPYSNSVQQISQPPAEMSSLIQRIERLETTFNNKNFNKNAGRSRKNNQCTQCLFINKKLGSSLKTNHPSYMCRKQAISISLLELEDNSVESESPLQSSDNDEGSTLSSLPRLFSS